MESDMNKTDIEYLKIEDIIPYENNPRQNDGAVEGVKESIRQFGFKVPMVIDKNNVIVCGHTRYKASKELGLTEIPCIRADDLTDEQIKAFRLADNKVSEVAEWDLEKLSIELADIDDIDMSAFGFEDIDIEDIEEVDIKEDEMPEEVETRCKLGDLWQVGGHRLICGDSTDITVIDRLMDGVKADMVFCDAPYGYKYESNYQDKYEMLQNDDKILDFIPAIWGTMKDNCPVYEFCGWQSLKQWLEYFENTSLDLKNVIIWKKNKADVLQTIYEPILPINNKEFIVKKYHISNYK